MDIQEIKSVGYNLAKKHVGLQEILNEYDNEALKMLEPFSENEKDLICAMSVVYFDFMLNIKSEDLCKKAIQKLIREFKENE